jgi:hypothetical protein
MIVSSGMLYGVIWLIGTSISKELADSTFRVKEMSGSYDLRETFSVHPTMDIETGCFSETMLSSIKLHSVMFNRSVVTGCRIFTQNDTIHVIHSNI